MKKWFFKVFFFTSNLYTATLWEPLPFFTMHKHYLQVTMCAATEDDFKKWEGWVHSRLRLLVQAVETCSGGALAGGCTRCIQLILSCFIAPAWFPTLEPEV